MTHDTTESVDPKLSYGHLPDCWVYSHGRECICDRLRACETRVREYLLTHNRSETLEWLKEDK